MNNLLARMPRKCWAYLALSIWAGFSFMLLHKTVYGIEESAARSLLLVWSVADAVISPVVTMGVPDFRTIFLAPIGLLWTGSVLAAKMATMLILAVGIWAVHRWRQHHGDDEGALLASGLLLLAPLTQSQIDTISVAAYLLFAFSLTAWSDHLYRNSPRAFGGMYFAQMFLSLVSVSFHPVGLALPLALFWGWYKNPLDVKQQKYFYTGIGSAVFIALILTSGWEHVNWFTNPIRGLSTLFTSEMVDNGLGAFRWITGGSLFAILLLVVWKQARAMWADLFGRTLLVALAIGLFVGDEIFGFVAVLTCLYWGIPLLLRKPEGNSSFAQQRGLVLALTFILSTTFMVFDKFRYQDVVAKTLSARDELIKTLAEDSGLFFEDEPNTPKKMIRIASQWPGLTMLACRCDALPLPPEAKDGDALLAMLKTINFLIFDPHDLANRPLTRNLSTIDSTKVETVTVQAGGAIFKIKTTPVIPAPQAPAEALPAAEN